MDTSRDQHSMETKESNEGSRSRSVRCSRVASIHIIVNLMEMESGSVFERNLCTMISGIKLLFAQQRLYMEEKTLFIFFLASKKNGGLGVSSFFAHNRALLFKWVWRFFTDESSLWSSFIKALFGIHRALGCKKIGNGEKTLFWDDIWSGDIAFKNQFKRLYALEVSKSISVAEKLGHTSICHSFRRLPRGGIEQELYNLLCSKVTTLCFQYGYRWSWSLEGSDSLSQSDSNCSKIVFKQAGREDLTVSSRLRKYSGAVESHLGMVLYDHLPAIEDGLLRFGFAADTSWKNSMPSNLIHVPMVVQKESMGDKVER
ncbi:hypothetical protein Tco_1013702 [Tanacetum coccineum]